MKGEQLGAFEELVLLAVHGLGEAAYGMAVQQVLERETGRAVSLGPVYTALDRLEGKRLVHSTMVAGTPTRGGRSRRVFRLTAAGSRALTSLQQVRARLYERARARLHPARSRS
jgi:PadR family transcriptional regulator, regulatory protein PadR